MRPLPTSASGLDALHQRLSAVAAELVPPADVPASGDRATDAAVLLDRAVQRLADEPDPARTWLLLVALSATYPDDDDVRAAARQLELASAGDSVIWLLEWAYQAARAAGSGTSLLDLVVDGVLVDVDFTAKNDLQTGIQRVVRHLVPRWARDHDVHVGVWTRGSAALRRAEGDELERVLRWRRPLRRPTTEPARPQVLVPWRSTLVLPEVPGVGHSLRLASLAQHSGNRVAVIGYDCIPVVSADVLPPAEPTKFVRYLSLVKHAHLVAGISESAAAEFRGFVRALPTQGLRGPQVLSCALATEVDTPPVEAVRREGDGEREVLVVGSHEPRKNHLAVLHAAEVLWREGLRFRLRFLGGSGWSTERFDQRLLTLRDRGRPVTAERGLDDDDLWTAFRSATFTVFPSLHEGYGLPVVESLALGTPVIGTGYGSVAEIASAGGVVPVDPRDDDALTDAMRRLLTDDAEIARLRQEALDRPVRTWDHYARDLWSLVSSLSEVDAGVGAP